MLTPNQISTRIPGHASLEAVIEIVASILSDANVAFGQGVDNADDEAAWLTLSACGFALDADSFDWQQSVSEEQRDALISLLLSRIADRQPLAYLLGETWFAGLAFFTDRRALIPRSYMAEWIPQGFAPWVDPSRINNVLDLCCGSGCIGIATAMYLPETSLVLSDLSRDALDVAAKNVSRHQLQHRTKMNQGSLFEGIDQRFDLILCNPPYVSSSRMATLPPEFREEPEIALHAGDDGLDFMRDFFAEVRNYLTDTGTMVVEVGSASAELEQAWPKVPFNWLVTEYDETVLFAMRADEFDANLGHFLQQ